MLRLLETYPWDRAFDGDEASECWLREVPVELFEKWMTLRQDEDRSWRGDNE